MTTGKYQTLATRVGALVDAKNAAYGNSFDKAGDFLRLLYPDGIKPEQYDDMLCLVRVFDKQKRIATARDALGESPWQDVVGYGLLALNRVEEGKQPEERCVPRYPAIPTPESESDLAGLAAYDQARSSSRDLGDECDCGKHGGGERA